MPALVAVVMGSRSDWDTMRAAVAVLDELEADGETRKPRRVVKGLLAMTVVALGVLGVSDATSVVSGETKE